jgi:hypothetical protein
MIIQSVLKLVLKLSKGANMLKKLSIFAIFIFTIMQTSVSEIYTKENFLAPSMSWFTKITYPETIDSSYSTEISSFEKLSDGGVLAFGEFFPSYVPGNDSGKKNSRFFSVLIDSTGNQKWLKLYDSLINTTPYLSLSGKDTTFIVFCNTFQMELNTTDNVYTRGKALLNVIEISKNGVLLNSHKCDLMSRTPACIAENKTAYFVGSLLLLAKIDKENYTVKTLKVDGRVSSIKIKDTSVIGAGYLYNSALAKTWNIIADTALSDNYKVTTKRTYSQDFNENFISPSHALILPDFRIITIGGNNNDINNSAVITETGVLVENGSSSGYNLYNLGSNDYGVKLFYSDDSTFLSLGYSGGKTFYLRKTKINSRINWNINLNLLNIAILNNVETLSNNKGYFFCGATIDKKAFLARMSGDPWILPIKKTIINYNKAKLTIPEYYTLNGKSLGSTVHTQNVNRVLLQKSSFTIKPIIQLK